MFRFSLSGIRAGIAWVLLLGALLLTVSACDVIEVVDADAQTPSLEEVTAAQSALSVAVLVQMASRYSTEAVFDEVGRVLNDVVCDAYRTIDATTQQDFDEQFARIVVQGAYLSAFEANDYLVVVDAALDAIARNPHVCGFPRDYFGG